MEDWPEIDLKYISGISKAIVHRIHELDEDQVFSAPVLETYPDIKDDYLKVVESPLDLRTIEEERVCQYESIKDLQKDLTLVFQNCCSFNPPESAIWKYTV